MPDVEYNSVSLIISGLVAFFTFVGLGFACVQLYQIKKNRRSEFEQKRREKTVEIVSQYSNSINDQVRATERIVMQLSDEQCQDLYNHTAFEVNERIGEQICRICPNRDVCFSDSDAPTLKCKSKKGRYEIKDETLYSLRGNVISYLNSLECVFLAWQLGIVDQSALEEEFVMLDKKRHKERALEIFRTIAGGGRSYPAIEKFYQHLDQAREKAAEKTLKEILK